MLAAALTEDESALQVELYYRFLKAQSQGFDGAFDEFVRDEVAQPVLDSIPVEDEEEEEVRSAETTPVMMDFSFKSFLCISTCCLSPKSQSDLVEQPVLGAAARLSL